MTQSTAARIAEALTGRPVKRLKDGNYLVCCPAHGDSSPSLSIRDSPRGLIVNCWAGCKPREVYAAIRAKGLKIERSDTPPVAPPKSAPEYQRQQAEKAAWLWSKRRPIAGSIAERYLREARNYSGPLPPTLAFLPPLKPEHHPALIAAFALVDEPEPGLLGKPQNVTAIHLTLLKGDGSGKADTKPNKITVGSPLGKPIVLAPSGWTSPSAARPTPQRQRQRGTRACATSPHRLPRRSETGVPVALSPAARSGTAQCDKETAHTRQRRGRLKRRITP
jgi:hypothetical protein